MNRPEYVAPLPSCCARCRTQWRQELADAIAAEADALESRLTAQGASAADVDWFVKALGGWLAAEITAATDLWRAEKSWSATVGTGSGSRAW